MTHSEDPAYPIANDKLRDAVIGPYGLTKRECFAAMAMQSIISKSKPGIGWMKKCAIHSVQMADALIAELNKRT